MKFSWFWVVLGIVLLASVVQGSEGDPKPKDNPGPGLEVAIEGDGGSCPPTSYGHGVETPCSSMKIDGPDTPSEDSQYSVEGGKPPYVWDISSGSINVDTGAIISLSGACGSGTVKVTDACGNTESLPVRFPSGKWVTTTNTGAPPWPTNYLWQRITSGDTRTTRYLTSCGCVYADEEYWMPGGCRGYNSKSGDTCPQGYQIYNEEICGTAPPTAFSSLPGEKGTSLVSSHPGWCYGQGNQVWLYGWRMYDFNPDYIKVEVWECP